MSDITRKLQRLSSRRPELRRYVRPILSHLRKTAKANTLQDFWIEAGKGALDLLSRDAPGFDSWEFFYNPAPGVQIDNFDTDSMRSIAATAPHNGNPRISIEEFVGDGATRGNLLTSVPLDTSASELSQILADAALGRL